MKLKSQARWLLLIHQIPPKPDYLRVKVWRKLQRLGSVAIKSSVYALPNTEQSCESFQWVMREITQAKGDASICEANFVEGLEDNQIEQIFNEARNTDYNDLGTTARKTLKTIPSKAKLTDDRRKDVEAELKRLKKRFSEVLAVDFFGAPSREGVEGLINQIDSRMKETEPGTAVIAGTPVQASELKGRTWVTRHGIHVDRIASAWLIRRFIDERAQFKFVNGKGYRPLPGELRFDMFEAEFTHEGDLCTFEVLMARLNFKDTALRQIAEIIHDIDLRDEKHAREDTKGIEELVNGICMAHKEDKSRLARGSALLDDLYEYFRRKHK